MTQKVAVYNDCLHNGGGKLVPFLLKKCLVFVITQAYHNLFVWCTVQNLGP